MTKTTPSKSEPNIEAGLHEGVGPRLRAGREQKKISLRELARRLGISPSAVSQIETGKSRPSVSTLYSIVNELGMSLDELFIDGAGDEKPVSPALRDSSSLRYVQSAATRQVVELESGVRWEQLTTQADPEADFLYVVYDVGGSSNPEGRLIRHSGREYGLVLSGMLEVTIGFNNYKLSSGDSISFDSTIPHRLHNVGPKPVRAVWFVIGRQRDAFTSADPGFALGDYH